MAWSIPGGVLAVVAVAVYELLRQGRRKRKGAPIAATYLNEVTAMFYGTKRVELDHQQSMSMMCDEEAQGAPPRNGVDLDGGVAVLRPDNPRSRPQHGLSR
ncbi:hypothetical protein BC739_006225 [Kutzneria viridogrisea]|uniref:Uncharacterized protein n=2 Tax=Kutzneria TaxID=43356 RepID=W5W5Y8_9PSEU|nr:DUF6191 domain-containing protein [Kutzneria albida]AHH93609.1 hypothetical protein KALB_232 [Kutzneria albida DSM 43870]MBA8929007.1 hypothetical protein [Kutzneria viridogrisea]